MGIFYTDANGLEMQKRNLTFEKGQATPAGISRSFYPVTSAIVIRDQEFGSLEDLTIMTTRT